MLESIGQLMIKWARAVFNRLAPRDLPEYRPRLLMPGEKAKLSIRQHIVKWAGAIFVLLGAGVLIVDVIHGLSQQYPPPRYETGFLLMCLGLTIVLGDLNEKR